MNQFLKDQQRLMQKAAATITTIEAAEAAYKEVRKDKLVQSPNVEAFQKRRMEQLRATYGELVTTLVKNLADHMGFVLVDKENMVELA